MDYSIEVREIIINDNNIIIKWEWNQNWGDLIIMIDNKNKLHIEKGDMSDKFIFTCLQEALRQSI